MHRVVFFMILIMLKSFIGIGESASAATISVRSVGYLNESPYMPSISRFGIWGFSGLLINANERGQSEFSNKDLKKSSFLIDGHEIAFASLRPETASFISIADFEAEALIWFAPTDPFFLPGFERISLRISSSGTLGYENDASAEWTFVRGGVVETLDITAAAITVTVKTLSPVPIPGSFFLLSSLFLMMGFYFLVQKRQRGGFA